jgi:DNA phosphorothioation-associated putative methyltransferase
MFSTPRKVVGSHHYLHVSVTQTLEKDTLTLIHEAEKLAKVDGPKPFNLIRLDKTSSRIALLNYPEFDNDPFPALRESWLVDISAETVNYRTYSESLNPPILHRKELLLFPGHPRREEYAELTKMAESIGLFEDTKRIGYLRQWLALIEEKGYRLDGYNLVPLGNTENDGDDTEPTTKPIGWEASRQKTALVRYGFSAPIQSLTRYGFLDGRYTVFDYGCGRGDDVRGLNENQLSASGWDPYFAPSNPISTADIVNLGFVINVIESFDERVEALLKAWELAERLIVVSVMLSNKNTPHGEHFRDGVMTQRGTFQKYFTQPEIKAFLQQVLDEEAIPVSPGVFYVFRDKDLEQRFLMDRYRSKRNQLRIPSNPLRKVPQKRRDCAEERYQKNRESLERLWQQWLSLGRKPDKSEVHDLLSLTEGFGSLAKALRFISSRYNTNVLDEAFTKRSEDLMVYFALNLFEQRRPYKHLERGLQRDIKIFFGDYKTSQATAQSLLFQIAQVESINASCQYAAEHGLGYLIAGESLQLHVSLVEQLPSLLRVYLGCAAVIYGDYHHADLLKIHIRSGKISLMRYDDFENNALPRMIERVKIKLREQGFDYFSYGEDYEPPFLFYKSRYINEEYPRYPEQVDFEEALTQLQLGDFSGYGPSPSHFISRLNQRRWMVNGFTLIRSTSLPALNEPCGQYLTFRQLIECGETQAKTGMENLPLQANTYNALYDLTQHVIDPVIDYFGMIQLTYGFCSAQLAKEIPGRICPKLDQHASHEINRQKNPICKRLGAAVDFMINDESMLEVAQWIVANTSFDRLYFYGKDKPIHVSFGPNQDGQVVRMVPSKAGKLVPRVVANGVFLAQKK